MKSAVTVSLVEEARGGPFVYWGDLWGAVASAGELGFDAVEVFAPSAEAVDTDRLGRELESRGMRLAAVGTGAGMLLRKLSLTAEDAGDRQAARGFVKQMIDMGAALGAPAIIGSMQGKHGGNVSKEAALGWLGEALAELGGYAAEKGTVLLYEPLNRFETNLVNTVADGVAMLDGAGAENVKLLADVFHMNIEEVDMAAAMGEGGERIGHVHFVDSNRRAPGFGHVEFGPIVGALREGGYEGYLSAEAVSWPDAEGAAKRTIETYRSLVGSS